VTLAVGLVAVVLFLGSEGRENADQWSSSLGFLVAYVGLAATVISWFASRAGVRPTADGDATSDLLRRVVYRQWSEEVQIQDLQRPKPLRLRWQVTQLQVVPASRAAGTGRALAGALVQDENDTRPAAVALAERFDGKNYRQLVVLGGKGAGKTTLAALYVLAATEKASPGDPVPVLLSVAGWDPADPIEEWIERRIIEDYPGLGATESRAKLRMLIRDGGVTAVLDGLDEMPGQLLNDALQELDRAASAGMRMLLTCRTAEYQTAVNQAGVLSHAAVVEIDPITVEDAAYYLTQREVARSRRWKPVLKEMRKHPDGHLATALDTPLMVSLARQAFESPNSRPQELTRLTTAQAVQHRLLESFVSSAYGGADSADNAKRYLSFLSHHLRDVVRDPNLRWWELARTVPAAVITLGVTVAATAVTVVAYAICTATVYGVLALQNSEFHMSAERIFGDGAVIIASFGAILGALAGFHASRSSRSRRSTHLASAIALDLGTVLSVLGMASGVGAAVLFADQLTSRSRALALSFQIQYDAHMIVESAIRQHGYLWLLPFVGVIAVTNALGLGRHGFPRRAGLRRRNAPSDLLFGLGVGAIFGLPVMVVAWFVNPGPAAVWPGIVLATGIGVPIAFGRWLNAPIEMERAPSPASVLSADRTALLVSAVLVAAAVLITAFPILVLWASFDISEAWLPSLLCAFGVFLVVLFGSGAPWVSYTTARLWLALRRQLPWRLSRFLQHAHDAGVLRQTGPAYQVRHDLVRNYLADQWQAPARLVGQMAPARWKPSERRAASAIVCAAMFALLPATILFVENDGRPRPAAVYDVSGLGGDVVDLALSADGKSVAAASFGSERGGWAVTRWTRDNGRRETTHLNPQPDEEVVEGHVSPTGVLAIVQAGGRLAIYDTSGQRLALAQEKYYYSADVAGMHFLTINGFGEIESWPTARGGRPVTLVRGIDAQRLAASARAEVFAAVDQEGIRVWNAGSTTPFIIPGINQGFGLIELSADGTTLAAASRDAVDMWQWDGDRFAQISEFAVRTEGMVVSQDGRFLATRDYKGMLLLWEAMTGKRIATLPRPSCIATAIAFSEDGTQLATGCGQQVKLWMVHDLVELQS